MSHSERPSPPNASRTGAKTGQPEGEKADQTPGEKLFDLRRAAANLGERLRERLNETRADAVARIDSAGEGGFAPPPGAGPTFARTQPGHPQPQAAPPGPAAAPFGGNSPFGKPPGTMRYETIPMHDEVICFNVEPLLKTFISRYHIDTASMNALTVETVVRAFEADRAKVQEVHAHLDMEWDLLGMKGAAFVYNWIDDVKTVLMSRFTALGKPSEVLLATDLNFVLNVLGRSRGTVLLANAPLVLEHEFLRRSLASDDPRLVAYAGSAIMRSAISIPARDPKKGTSS